MDTQDLLRRISRRQFLGSSAKNAAGVAAGMVGVGLAGAALAETGEEPIRLGVIGLRGHGRKVALDMLALPGVAVSSVCDVDAQVLSTAAREIAERQGAYPRKEGDFRRLLDDPNVDAVVITTPDHWHAHMAVLACRAGKDVYLEPPVTHTLSEGHVVLAAAEQHNRVVQVGLQQRSGEHFRSAVEFVRSGQLGEVALAKAWAVHRRKPIGVKRESAPPAGVDYELWLGPAPQQAFTFNRFHQNWRWFWDYGSGELGNLGVHLLDVARWGLDVGLPREIVALGGRHVFVDDQETPDTLQVNFLFPGEDGRAGRWIQWEHRLWSNHGIEGRSAAVAFYGERGTLIVDRGGWKVYGMKDAPAVDASDCTTPHYVDFLRCVRTREMPAGDLRNGVVSSALCQLGNIACRLGRPVKFDPALSTFGTDTDANMLLRREYSRDWPLG